MYILLIIFLAYLSWVVPQYIMHRFAHFLINNHRENVVTFGETKHHKYGKSYNYDIDLDPDLKWINVNIKFIILNILIISIILFMFFGLMYSSIFFIFCLLFSSIDLYIHKRIHLGHEGHIVNVARYLHSIHHKTWKYNYSIFLGIPIDFIFLTFRLK